MPEPNDRTPYQVAPEIAGWPLWVLIDQNATVMIECDGCHHRASWTPAYLAGTFPAHRGKGLFWLAGRLRCGRCRSGYVRLWRAAVGEKSGG